MTGTPSNLSKYCEGIVVEHGALEHCTAIEARRHEDHRADLQLIFDSRDWLQSQAGDALVNALEEDSTVKSARRRKSAIHVRFEDDVLANVERQLAAGVTVAMEPENTLSDQRVTISYVGPNTNKALHVGHLRNLVLGEALSSTYEAGGVSVRRHNLIGDIGRRVCEAMGGYMTFHSNESPEASGIPGDQFVELCYRDYSLQQTRAHDDEKEADPNSEERKRIGDLADEIMEKWLAGSTSERELWALMRAWVLDGHERTLTRMGTTFDHCDFESENIDRTVALLEEGLERGVVEREDSGAIVYRTTRSEYPTMVLIREDGFPTEHARLLGTYDRILDELHPGEPYVEVAGYEWQPPVTVLSELHERLRPGPRDQDQRFYHASVTWADGAKIGSSTGQVLWIEDFLDEVAASPLVAELEAMADEAVPRRDIADILVRATFLSAPVSHPLPLATETLMTARSGPGWTIAEAWCLATAANAGSGDGPVARTGIMQAQHYHRYLERAIEKRDVTTMFRYLVNLSESFLSAEAPGPAAVPALRRTLAGLGFLAGKSDPNRREMAEASTTLA